MTTEVDEMGDEMPKLVERISAAIVAWMFYRDVPSQVALADGAGISRQTLNRILKNHKMPDLATLHVIATYLDVPLDVLVRGDMPPKKEASAKAGLSLIQGVGSEKSTAATVSALLGTIAHSREADTADLAEAVVLLSQAVKTLGQRVAALEAARRSDRQER